MKLPKLIAALIASLGLVLPGFAQDDEDEERLHRRTKSEIRAFLEKHFAEPLQYLRHAEEEGNKEGVEEFWREAGELVGEFHHLGEELGGKAAEAFLHVRRTGFIADRLTKEFHESDNEAHRAELKAKLHEIIGAHVEHRLHLERAELDRARRELEEAAHELQEAFAHHAKIVEEELHERLHREEDKEHEDEKREGDEDGDDEDDEDEGDEDGDEGDDEDGDEGDEGDDEDDEDGER